MAREPADWLRLSLSGLQALLCFLWLRTEVQCILSQRLVTMYCSKTSSLFLLQPEAETSAPRGPGEPDLCRSDEAERLQEQHSCSQQCRVHELTQVATRKRNELSFSELPLDLNLSSKVNQKFKVACACYCVPRASLSLNETLAHEVGPSAHPTLSALRFRLTFPACRIEIATFQPWLVWLSR